MQFMDGDQLRTGEVWSPGPVARSVWVLVDGEAVAVKLATGKRPAQRIEWTPPMVGAVVAMPSTSRTRVVLRAYSQHDYRAAHVDVPQLSAKDWRTALGEQLTLAPCDGCSAPAGEECFPGCMSWEEAQLVA